MSSSFAAAIGPTSAAQTSTQAVAPATPVGRAGGQSGRAETPGGRAVPPATADRSRSAGADAGNAQRALDAAARQIESFMRDAGRELEFRVDEASGQVVVNIRNPQTGELIRQIPDAAFMAMAERIIDMGTRSGVLVEEWS